MRRDVLSIGPRNGMSSDMHGMKYRYVAQFAIPISLDVWSDIKNLFLARFKIQKQLVIGQWFYCRNFGLQHKDDSFQRNGAILKVSFP
ncbi:hypothetical protein SELSPUOL_00187 [Selenomonas sputigena ATCC 35185]|uniref:Uncharacterized protein n=1 Tax=Selenomonas sputigena (strain ATCC 35185 / DSM 20758 / CCUG 44933 / VPI D19B-28) TaxID=546271 RepID=C9LRW6_SELS3|nr:hypothetical protein SELSPUOL_00187 [Selenomonas sputigena ATCC 35185]